MTGLCTAARIVGWALPIGVSTHAGLASVRAERMRSDVCIAVHGTSGGSCAVAAIDGKYRGHVFGRPLAPSIHYRDFYLRLRTLLVDLERRSHGWRLSPTGPGTSVCLAFPGCYEEQRCQEVALALQLAIANHGRHFDPGRDLLVVDDVEAGLAGGVMSARGVFVAVGRHGAATFARAGRRRAKVSGNGPILDDEGSACWLGMAAVGAVLRSTDRRHEPECEQLTRCLLRELSDSGIQLTHPRQITYRFENIDVSMLRERLARAAAAVFAAAAKGCEHAWTIMQGGAELIAKNAVAAVRAVSLSPPFRIAYGGTLFTREREYGALVARRLKEAFPSADVGYADCPPVIGAALFALARQDDLPAEAHTKGFISSLPRELVSEHWEGRR